MKNMRKHNGNFLLFTKVRKIMELLLLMVLFAKMAQGAVLVDVLAQNNDIASGTDWTLDADGKLTITSDAGMTDWSGNRSTYKSDVITIEISDGVSRIPSNAFTECRSLTAVAIPETVTSIGRSVFTGCSSLEDVTIPDGVDSLGALLFGFCSSLKTITIPASVTSIDNMVFSRCNALETVIMEGDTPPTLGSNVFEDCGFVIMNEKGIHAPKGKADDYKAEWADWEAYILEDIIDTQPPAGSIRLGDKVWSVFQSAPVFELFFKEEQQVTIEAEDSDSGVDGIYYHISDSVLSLAQAEALSDADWIQGESVSISQDGRCVIYVKITDQAGNVTYLSTEGLVFDKTAPVIEGVTDGEEYNTPQSVTVTDENLERVTVNGTAVILRDNQFTLEAADDAQTIIATDKAGNTTTVTVTVNTGAEDAKEVAAAKRVVEEALAGYTASNATTKEEIESIADTALGKAGITGVTVTVTGFTKTEATTAAAGTVSADIVISRKNATDSIRVDKTIAKLEQSHTHKFGTAWESNETSHWHECDCGEKSEAFAHQFGEWITDKEATKNEAGLKHRVCQTCGYEEKETIPADTNQPDQDAGKLEQDVLKDDKAPVSQISTPVEEMADIVLTSEEKQQLAQGTDIRIILDVKDASDSVGSADKALVETVKNGYETGQYLDISLFKIIGENRSAISKTNGKITVTITVPDALKNTDNNMTRTFAVIRVHDNKAELLEDLDESAETITIATDRFSTYAIVYKDTSNGGSTGDDGGNNDNDNNDSGNNDSGNNDNDNNDSDNNDNDNNDSGNNDNDNNDSGNNDNDNNDGGNNDNDNNDNGNNDSDDNDSDDDEEGGQQENRSPMTGDGTPFELYMVLVVMTGFVCLFLYFTKRRSA